MRLMSFALTTSQVLARTKTVTRRTGWQDLKPGTLLRAVKKAQGLRKGEHPSVLATIRVVSVNREPLGAILRNLDYGFEEVEREGFGRHPSVQGSPACFVEFLQNALPKSKRPKLDDEITRIEFEYVTEAAG